LLLAGRVLEDGERLDSLLPHGVAVAELQLVRAEAEIVALRDLKAGRVDLEDLDEEFRGRRAFVLAAVREDGFALEHASEALRDDREVVLAAVADAGAALQHAGAATRNSREVVITAIRQNGDALQFASEALRGSRELCLEAARANWRSLRFITKDLSGDSGFMLAALRETRNPEVFRNISRCLQVDKGLFLNSVKDYPHTFCYAAAELQFDKTFVLELVHVNGRAIGFASDVVKEDPEVMAAAVENAPDAVCWAQQYSSYAR